MLQFRQAQTDEDTLAVRELFWEYLQWANARVNEEFGVNFDIRTMLEDDMNRLDIYLPPDGRLILVSEESRSAGLGYLKKTRDDIGEIKRMYIRPEFRGRGFGRKLLQTLLSEAKDIGYSGVRLDSARFMEAAHSLLSVRRVPGDRAIRRERDSPRIPRALDLHGKIDCGMIL